MSVEPSYPIKGTLVSLEVEYTVLLNESIDGTPEGG